MIQEIHEFDLFLGLIRDFLVSSFQSFADFGTDKVMDQILGFWVGLSNLMRYERRSRRKESVVRLIGQISYRYLDVMAREVRVTATNRAITSDVINSFADLGEPAGSDRGVV
jgi:hypothetical protein